MIETLYPFQRETVLYLKGQKSALIADEMGLGKTLEAIARDQLIREETVAPRDTLVIAPLTTLESTWKAHFERLTNLSVVVVNPKDRDGSWMDFLALQGGVFCVHWEALRLMPQLRQKLWIHIIADECHRMKNRKSQQTGALKAIEGVNKTAMSGTPVVNRPDELWSVLNWLNPHVYRSYWKFFKLYVETEDVYMKGRVFRKVVGPQRVPTLQREIRPFFIRRLKSEVLTDLPEKYYTELKVDLSPIQRRAYDTMRKEMIAWVGEQRDELLAAPVVIAQLTRLQQFAVAFAEIGPDGRLKLAEPSSKLDTLMQIIDDTDTQIVVFSRFKSLIRLLGRRLKDIPHVILTGDTPQHERAGLVEQFQAGRARIFAGTIGAGGVGITLTASSTVVFLDRDWSPALNLQAEDRLHRIGQRQAVQVIDIMAKSTIDQGRAQRLTLKSDMIRRMLGD